MVPNVVAVKKILLLPLGLLLGAAALWWPSLANPCPWGRGLAVARSQDQDALAQVTVQDENTAVRAAAAAKVTAAGPLARVAREAKDEKLRVKEEERLAKKKADLEKEKELAALRIVRNPTEDPVVLGTSKFVIAEARKSAEMQDKFTKSGDIIVLLKEIEVSLVKAEADFSQVTYKTKKFYVESKFLFEKTK